jgi:hypothetical protein
VSNPTSLGNLAQLYRYLYVTIRCFRVYLTWLPQVMVRCMTVGGAMALMKYLCFAVLVASTMSMCCGNDSMFSMPTSYH